MINLPRVYTRDLSEYTLLPVGKTNITFNLKTAPTAGCVVPFSADKLTLHTFIQLFNVKGSCGFFRITGETETMEKERQLVLKGAIDVLMDYQWTENSDFSGTTDAYVEKLLSFQKTQYWTLGECDDTQAFEKTNLAYANLQDLLLELLTQKTDLYPVYDFSVFPWRLNLKKMPDAIGAELRLRRNLASGVRLIRDDKNQCTRLNLSVVDASGDASVTVYNAEEAQAVYGVIEKSAEINSADVEDVDAWVKDYFDGHAAPYISITAPAVELYAQTGDTWDEMSVGKKARVALPAYGETYIERVSAVSYPDVYATPSAVTVTLANPVKTLSETVRDTRDLAVSTAQGLSQAEKDLSYWEMIVKEIRLAQDETGITEMWKSGIILDADEGVKIFSMYQGFSALYSDIRVNAEQILLRVQKNGVIAAINLTSEEAKISASRIVLDGLVTTSELEAVIAETTYNYSVLVDTNLLRASTADIEILDALTLSLGGSRVRIGALTMGSLVSKSVLTTATDGVNLAHSHAVTVSDSGVVTLGEVAETGGNFNIADTKVYKDGVSAAYSEGYAAGSAAAGDYTTGYEAGWLAAAAMATSSRNGNVITVKRPSSIVDTPADDTVFTVGAGGAIASITNTAANTFHAQGRAHAYVSVNGGTAISVATANLIKTQTINVGQ